MTWSDSDTVEMDQPDARNANGELPSTRVQVEFHGATHPGHVRTNNEDFFLVSRAERSFETLLTNLPAGEVPRRASERAYGFVVADGMGGQAAGEVASRLALRTLVEDVITAAEWIMRDIEPRSDEIEERIAGRFAKADEAVHASAVRHPEWAGMGTTMTLAVNCGATLFLGHVGDSRAYVLRQGDLHLLTRDHTFAQSLADDGIISQAEVPHHRLRNMLLRSLGGESAQADVQHLTLESGDQLLVCTDGLTEMLSEPVIKHILQTAETPELACTQLIEGALVAGGRDNVTVVVARFAW